MTEPLPPVTTDNGYRYSPLPSPRAIRLIMLQRSAADDAPMCCEIVETDLEDPGEYAALSYTWGGESPSLPMTVLPAGGGDSEPQVMLLTPNCAAALRVLRRRIGGAGTGLWVDAVCINQGHHGEKNAQAVAFSGSRSSLRSCISQAPYWNRAWTVQEAAHVGAVLLCRDSGVLDLGAAFDAVWVYCPGRSFSRSNIMMHHNRYLEARRLAGDGRIRVSAFGRWNVADVAAKGASDPRDRVFALRSAYPDSFGRVEVDYGRDVGEVFAEATRCMVERNVEILLEAGGPGNALGMPSWAVDWASEKREDSLWTDVFQYGTASGGSAARHRLSDDGRRLYLTGAVVGRVHGRYVSEVLPSFFGQIENITALEGMRIIDGIIGGVSSWVYEVSAAPAAAAAAADDDDDDDAETPNETELAVAEADRIPASVIRLISHVAMKSSYPTSRKTQALLLSRLENKDATRDIRWIVSGDVILSLPLGHYENSRLFLTTEGCFGWGHAGLLPGDLICAVAGLLYPMAMRHKGSSYVIVGPTVLDGVMKGERWPADEGDLEEWEIV